MRPFQWFRFCEERSAVVVFFLEAFGGAHLQSIRGVWQGQAPSRPLDRTWAGWLFGWDQPPNSQKWLPSPPSTRAA